MRGWRPGFEFWGGERGGGWSGEWTTKDPLASFCSTPAVIPGQKELLRDFETHVATRSCDGSKKLMDRTEIVLDNAPKLRHQDFALSLAA